MKYYPKKNDNGYSTVNLFFKASAGSHYKSFDSLTEAILFAAQKKLPKSNI